MDAIFAVREAIGADREAVIDRWVALQLGARTLRPDLLSEPALREEAGRFVELLDKADGPKDADLRAFVTELSRSRAYAGFSPSETATFVLSLKQPLFERLQGHDDALRAIWAVSELLDDLALLTTEAYQASREEVIRRQGAELLELSTPVMQVWEGVLVLPLIGTLDSQRAQVVMEELLERIVATRSHTAIIDITGVPTVDTLVAQHLLKTVAAARLMGADCLLSGIRPQIAQTIVHLGLDLQDVETKTSLADALTLVLRRRGTALPVAGDDGSGGEDA
jgi:rsbT co-antagonist protein RsbR